MPAVSVILPTCDRPDLWPRALESILAQSWSDLEVLLVDSNRSAPPVRSHPAFAALSRDVRVRLIEAPHRACSAAARNAGLQVARGEWISYLDDDDIYLRDKIQVQLTCAKTTGAPFVLCGYTVVRPLRRRIRQVKVGEYCGDDLLTSATWCTPLLFHRCDPSLRFDESLLAGEDEVFAHNYFDRHHVMRVPNCSRSLVEMYRLPSGSHVHANCEAVWKANLFTARRWAKRYSRSARRAYLARGRLTRAQGGYGSSAHFVCCAVAVFQTSGITAWRLVANASARRRGLLRNWIVS